MAQIVRWILFCSFSFYLCETFGRAVNMHKKYLYTYALISKSMLCAFSNKKLYTVITLH